MKLYIRSIVFLIFYTIVLTLKVNSQNISGDTIFINNTLTYTIVLPTSPTSFSTIPGNSSYKIKPEKGFIIITTDKENLPPVILKVSEGGRTHNFTIIYEKDIDYSDPNTGIKDYPTLKKLQERVDQLALHKSAAVEKKQIPIDQNDINKQTATESVPAVVIVSSGVEDKSASENNSKYLKIITEAGTHKQAKNYNRARELFTEALSIKPGDALAIKELVETNALLKQDSAQKENQRLNDNYKQHIAEGESAYNKNQFSEARAAYEQALRIRPNDVIAIKYIKLIEAKQKDQAENGQLTKNYEASVALADKLFSSEDYDNSRAAYKTALGFIKKDYPEKQISKIDQIVSERLNKVKMDKQKLAKDEKEAIQYATLIKNGDAEFEKGNLTNAKKMYNEALVLRPAEEYPKNKEGIIEEMVIKKAGDLKAKNDSIGEANETNKKYLQALKQGKAYSAKKDLLMAKNAYEEAMKLKPLEKEPETQLQIINRTLVDIAQKNETDSNYNRFISLADSLYKVKLYASALKTYSEAQALKPAEVYPGLKIKSIQFELAKIERINENNKRIEEEKIYNEAISSANKYISEKQNYEAKSAFIKAESIHLLTKTDQQRFNNLLYQIDLYQKDSVSKIPVITTTPQKPKRKKLFQKKGKNNSTFKIWLKPLRYGFDWEDGFLSYAKQQLKA